MKEIQIQKSITLHLIYEALMILLSISFVSKGAQSNCLKLFEILVSQERSYFSHDPCQISQLKSIPFGRYQ